MACLHGTSLRDFHTQFPALCRKANSSKNFKQRHSSPYFTDSTTHSSLLCHYRPSVDCLPRRSRLLATSTSQSSPVVEASLSETVLDVSSGEDSTFMTMAVQLSRQALGKTSPNPMVGCVIVKDGIVVGRGFHPKAGDPHAEVFALREAGENAAGATAYVTLEPCNHFGRTPPCSQALVRAKVKRVVVGTVDPNPLVAGSGIRTLEKAGIEVTVGVEEELCKQNVEAFFCRITQKRPFSTLRYNMSMDGKSVGSIISSHKEPAGSHFSLLLAEYDAVIVTHHALVDDPLLLSLETDSKQPLRVVIASSLDLNRSASVFDTSVAHTVVVATEEALVNDVEASISRNIVDTQTWLIQQGVEVVIVNEIDVDDVLEMCYQRNVSSALWDSRGSTGDLELAKKVLDEGVVDKVVVEVVPVMVGKEGVNVDFVLGDGVCGLSRVSSVVSGDNVIVSGYVVGWP